MSIEYISFNNLMQEWLVRMEYFRSQSKALHKDGDLVSSGVCFGKEVAVADCLEELIDLLDHLQKQGHDVRARAAATRLKYVPDVPIQERTSLGTDNGGKTDERCP